MKVWLSFIFRLLFTKRILVKLQNHVYKVLKVFQGAKKFVHKDITITINLNKNVLITLF